MMYRSWFLKNPPRSKALVILIFASIIFLSIETTSFGFTKAELWPANPVKQLRVAGVNFAPDPVLMMWPIGIGEPTWTKPNTPLDTIVRLTNLGNADLHFSAVNILYQSGGPTGWISYSPPLSTIPYEDPNYVDITLTLGTGISTDGIGLSGGIEFVYDAPSSPDTFLIFLIVADTVQFPEYTVIHTACMPLIMNNAGQLGADGGGYHTGFNMNFYDDCDTTDNDWGFDDISNVYLYEASPFILSVTANNDTVLNSFMFNATWLKNDGFRPLEGISIDSSGSPGVMIGRTGRFLTHDSLIVLKSEMYAPQHPDSCGFFVQKLFIYQNEEYAEGTIQDLFIGELMDWDIPSDSGLENGSGYDESLQLMYCFGAEYGPDAIVNNDCVLADQRLGGIAYYGGYRLPHGHAGPFNYIDSFPTALGAWTGTNADWVVPTGQWVSQDLYEKMANFVGYESWASQNPGMEDSLYQDLNMVSVFGQFNLGMLDTLVFVKIFSTTYNGLSDLQSNIIKARQWIVEHDLFQWPPLDEYSCCNIENAGDATADGTVNLLDILFLIGYLYGDPAGAANEDCPELMSPNGDSEINLLDILYLIAYKYNSPPGPAPVCP